MNLNRYLTMRQKDQEMRQEQSQLLMKYRLKVGILEEKEGHQFA